MAVDGSSAACNARAAASVGTAPRNSRETVEWIPARRELALRHAACPHPLAQPTVEVRVSFVIHVWRSAYPAAPQA